MFDPIAWLAHAPYGVRVFLGILLLFWAFATTFTAALRAVPEERYNALEKASPRLGHFFRALRKWGTDVVAFVRELVRAFVGNWRQPPPLPLLLVALVGAASLGACSPSAIQRQATAAHYTAEAANRALPLVRAEYLRAGRRVIDDACCDEARMREALAAHQRRWRPVIVAWEGARVTHDAWRLALERCRSQLGDGGTDDAGTCGPTLGELAARALDAMVSMRCALRTLDPALDPLPGPLSCSATTTTDGGV